MIETDIVVSAGLRITCTKDELAQALGVVSRALSTRTSVQILSGVLLEARGGELRLAATDMELSLRASVSAQIEGDGAIVLPGKTLVDIARLLPGDEVTIEHRPTESVVHVTAGSASYTLNTYNPEDFPRLPELDAVSTFSVERESLLETIQRVARAASRDESRPVLTGVLVQFEERKVDHPQKLVSPLVDQAELGAEVRAQPSEHAGDDVLLVSREQDGRRRLAPEELELRLREKLGDR